jgi:uncharacterized phage infection (PIP) family protein YhgE
MSLTDSKISKIQTQFQNLTSVANSLNTASDELTKVVSVLDEALKKLNVGLEAWVTFSKWSDEHRSCAEQVGYCKLNGKWGIAIQRLTTWTEAIGQDEDDLDGPWHFNEAARDIRLEAVDKLPELIEELGKQALHTTKKVQEKTNQVRELATAITEITNSPKAKGTPTSIGISPNQIQAIIEGAEQTSKFVGELLHNVHQWARTSDQLHIHFLNEKFASLLQEPGQLEKLNPVVNHVLGMPVVVKVHPEKGRK